MNNSSFEVLEIRNSYLKNVDFSKSQFQKLLIKNSILENVSFSQAKIVAGQIDNTRLSETEWHGLRSSSLEMNDVRMDNTNHYQAFDESHLNLKIAGSHFEQTEFSGIHADIIEIENSFFSNLSINEVTAKKLVVSKLKTNEEIRLEDAQIDTILFQDCQPGNLTFIELERLESRTIEFDKCSFRFVLLDRLITDALTFRNALISEGGTMVPKKVSVLTFANMELNGVFWNPWDLKNNAIQQIKASNIAQGEGYLFVADSLPASLVPEIAKDSSLSAKQQIERAVRQYLTLLKQGEWKRSLGSYFPPKKLKGGEKGIKKYYKKYQRFADKLILNQDYYPEPGSIEIEDGSASVEWGELTFVLVNIQGKWMIRRIY